MESPEPESPMCTPRTPRSPRTRFTRRGTLCAIKLRESCSGRRSTVRGFADAAVQIWNQQKQKPAEHGAFFDYLERRKVQQREALKRSNSKKTLFRQKTSALAMKADSYLGLEESGNGLFDNYLSQDQLHNDLAMCVLPFVRERGDPAWALPTLETLKEHIRFICKSRHLRFDLRVRVAKLQFQMSHEVQQQRACQEASRLKPDERTARHKGFFKSYHSSHSKVDLRVPSSKGKLRLIDSSPKTAQLAFSASLNKRQGDYFADLLESPCIDAEGIPALAKLDSWKLRNCRGGKLRKAWELPRQLSRIDDGSSVVGGRMSTPMATSNSWSPAMTASRSGSPANRMATTLSGGWGFQEVSKRDGRRCRTADSMPRISSEPLLTRASKLDMRRPGTEGGLLNQQRKMLNRTEPVQGAAAASRSNHPFLRAAASAPQDLFGELQGHTPMNSPSAFQEDKVKEAAAPEPIINLPRMERNPFNAPWRTPGASLDVMDGPDSPQAKYLRETELNCITPKLIPFITGHSGGLNAANQALNDCDLLAMGTMLANSGELDVLDLSGNPLLTEKSLVPFLERLFDHPVTTLNLKHCLRYTLPPGIKEVLDVVENLVVQPNGLTRLKSLNLAGVQMGMRTQVRMCQAVQEHSCIKDVCLADTGIGGAMAKQCIQEITKSGTLSSLDLSWNSFTPEEFQLLGDRLGAMGSLKTLSIANCSAAQSGPDNPISFFIEALSRVKSLTLLDISVNRITFRGMLVLEDALENNMNLKEVTISNNPFGVLGMRSLLRVLARESSGLVHFTFDGCAGGSTLEAVGEEMQVFRAVNPCGRYTLNLSRTYHRAMLRMFYKSCERFKVAPDLAFLDVSFSQKGYSHPSKDEHGIYQVLQQGRLTFTFSMERAAESVFKGVSNWKFELYLKRYHEVMRLQPGFQKMTALLAIWKSVDGRSAEQMTLLDAMSKDFNFSYAQIGVLCGSRQIITDILYRLLPLVEGGAKARFLATRQVTGIGEYVKLHKRMRNLEKFNVQNPTGHYKLDLESPMDYNVAECLVLLDRWETGVARELGRADTSQRGNRSRFRNERFQEMPIHGVSSVAEWNLPEWEIFECDYVSGKRPPENAQTLDDDTYSSILVTLQNSDSIPQDQLVCLMNVSHFIHISAQQIRQLLGLYKEADVRTDLVVGMFMQITDIHNEKVFRVRFDSKKEINEIRNRLGQMTFFPFIQPEQSQFELDFRWHDCRLAMMNLLLMTNKERYTNIKHIEFRHMDGTLDPLPLGVPRTWEYLDRVPHEGVFRCTYMCAPEDRKVQERKRLIETYGWWPGPNSEADVNWWAALTEAQETPDVIEFLYFLCASFKNVHDAFIVIDGGPNGNKNINLREFEEGIDAMKCNKFNGKNKVERLTSIFRYLDPSGEGQVSEGEWGILEQLFKEIQLCIREFAHFLERTFKNLDDAWNFLDSDGSGAISFPEWQTAVESMGYFGPAKPIFSYLDKDNEGSIEIEEFNLLKEFLPDAL